MYRKHILSVAALGLMLALAVGSTDSSGTTTTSTTSRKIEAWVMAQEFVKKQLKSPSTASFGSAFSGDYQDPDSVVTELGDKRFRVSAWVDSQNSFGATVRTRFVCELEDTGTGSWRCTSLEFDE